jgi:hypothetical protein
VVDLNQSNAEIVEVTNVSGSNVTFTRASQLGSAAYGSTTQTHSAGVATFQHISHAADFAEANAHILASSGVHGVTGSVVGTSDTQTLANKTLTQPTIGDFTHATHTHANAANGGSTLTSPTLTTPTINNPTLSGSGGALTLPAGPDTIVGRATTDTLTNKTLTSPTINTPVISTITNTGTLTLPTSTDTLVGRNTTDTLTKKTLSPSAAANPGVVVKGLASQTGHLASFQDSTGAELSFVDSAGRFVPVIPGTETHNTSSNSTIVTATTLVTAPAITGDGATQVEITACVEGVEGTYDGDEFILMIQEDGTTIQQQAFKGKWATDSLLVPGHLSIVRTPTAASHTYTLVGQRIGGSGDMVVVATGASPMILRVKQFN